MASINTDAAADNASAGIAGVTVGTTKVGTQTGLFGNTSYDDASYHTITHATNAIDWVYQFLCGGGMSAEKVVWTGYLNSSNDIITVAAWNHVGGSWQNIGRIIGQTGTTNITNVYQFYPRHIGTSAAELGKVYIRLYCTGMSSPVLYTDHLYVGYGTTVRTAGYAEGAVWLDTITGHTGTESFVYGTADNPVATIGEAMTIATAVGLRRIRVINGSTVILGAPMTNFSLVGKNWNLSLNAKSIAGLYVEGATITGNGTGNGITFSQCHLGAIGVAGGDFIGCKFAGTMTMTAGEDYSFIQSSDADPDPIFVFAANVTARFRNWSGGLQFNALSSTNEVSIDGRGHVRLHTNCTGGTVIVRGPYKVTDTVVGGFLGTLTNTEQLGALAGQGGTVLTSAGYNTASSFYTDLPGGNDFWNYCLVLITSGVLKNQMREVGDFADTNGVVTLTSGQAFTATPADGTTFAIINR